MFVSFCLIVKYPWFLKQLSLNCGIVPGSGQTKGWGGYSREFVGTVYCTYGQSNTTIGWYIEHSCIPNPRWVNSLIFGHAPLNSHRFLASDLR